MGDEADQTLIQVPSRVTIVKIWIKRKLLNTKLQKENKLAWEALYWCIWQSSEWVHLDKNLKSVELTYSVCVCVFKTVGSCSQNLLLMFYCFQINKFSFLFSSQQAIPVSMMAMPAWGHLGSHFWFGDRFTPYLTFCSKPLSHSKSVLVLPPWVAA